jgi:hypothetical protein
MEVTEEYAVRKDEVLDDASLHHMGYLPDQRGINPHRGDALV